MRFRQTEVRQDILTKAPLTACCQTCP